MKTKKHPPNNKQTRTEIKNMETNTQQSKQQQAQSNERPGFYINVMPVLSKDGNYVRFFIGDMTITEHANRFKGLMGLAYTPKETGEKQEYIPRVGLHAKVKVFLSNDKEWVTVALPGNLGRIRNHVNAYKHIFGVAYEKKAKKAA
jgi:hypothetical protein